MIKMKYKLTLGLIAAITFACGVILNTASVAQLVQAQSQNNKTDVQRWEHCSVLPVNSVFINSGNSRGLAMIYYVRDGGYHSEKIEATSANDKSDNINKVKTNAIAKAVSKLQNEGWEMIGEGSLIPFNSTEQKVIYFKRRMQ